MMPMPMTPNPLDPSTGARLVASDGRPLPLRGTHLAVHASGGLARVVLVQRFDNPYDEPLTVRYQLPLPADGAVSGFAFELGDRRIVGEVDGRARARKRFEEAIVEGRSAGLLEQSRSSLFVQELGNLPPRAAVVAEIVVDQPLAWLPEGSWEWRFPTVVAPRYQGAPGRVADRDAQMVDVADGAIDVRAKLELVIAEPLADGGAPSSQTHALHVSSEGRDTHVALRSAAGAALDRDIAIRWPARRHDRQTRVEVARPIAGHPGAEDGYGLLTLVPPSGSPAAMPRDLILLLDTSGSMHGQPLEQVQRVAIALVESLDDDDSLQMISFSSGVSQWEREPQCADRETKRRAVTWLQGLRAAGGTEMHQGILAALEPLRAHAQRQVVLFTDGLIGFEDEIVGAIESRLPRGCRVHCVGVGSAVNRSLTGPAARAGRGVESIVALGEDAERASRRLVAHCAAPLVVDVAVEGGALREHAPRALPDLYAGAPALISLRLDPAGGELRITGRTPDGAWEQTLEVAPTDRGEGSQGVVARFARERIEDLETSLAAAPERRTAIDAEIERLGLDFQIASRLTSWVAISAEVDVDPRAPGRREVMPHELPHGMSLLGLGLRSAQPSVVAAAPMALRAAMPAAMGVAAGAPPRMAPRRPAGPPAPAPAGPPPPPASAAPARAAAPPPPPGAAPPPAQDEPKMQADQGYARGESFDDAERYAGAASPDEAEGYAELGRAALPGDAEAADGAVDEPARERAPRARTSRSLARRLIDGVREAFGGAPTFEAKGRIVVHDDRRLVIEIAILDELSWAPREARLLLSDGRQVAVTVNAEAGTREGPASAGQTLRLALTLPSTLAARPASVHLTLDHGTMVVHLTP